MSAAASGRAAELARQDAGLHAFEEAAASLPLDLARPVHDGPLSGLTIGVKANIRVAGQAWTAGIGARRGEMAGDDAEVVARLLAAGARLLSRLAMDEAALGATGENPHFGRTDNPATPGHSPGGSSAGSAAAVAAGLADAALGTDTLGSVRIPAAWCGVAGLKPGPGRLSLSGVFPLAPRFDAVGLLARDVATLGRVWAVLTGGSRGSPAPCRVGVPVQAEAACAPEVAAAFARAAATMRGRGLAIVPLPMPGWAPGAGRKAAFLATEVAAAEALAGQPGLSPGLRGMLDHGLRLSAERRDGIARTLEDTAAAFSAALDTVDVIATPTTSGLPVPRGTPPPADQADFTAPANIAGLPALSLPVGGAPRPVGLHLLGRPGAEEGLLDLAEQLAPYLT